MRIHNILKNKIIFVLIFFSFTILTSVDAQELLSPVFRWKPQFDFSGYLQNIFYKEFSNVGEMKDLNYEGTVSIVAIPTLNNPVNDIEQLIKGKTIGGIFLSTGSVRLNLPPGAYRVNVAQVNSEWKALFLDGNNHTINQVPAQVTRASRVEKPYAYVDRSVCYRFDETLVCY
ncbi:MAG: hypothetical protein AB1427_09885 [Thermodesulfobacteriota bacterium]